MSEIREYNEETKEITTEEAPKELSTKSPPVISGSNPAEMQKLSIAKAMDMDYREISKNDGKMNTIMDWVKTQTDDLSPDNIQWVLRELGTKLGSTPFNETRIAFYARYAYLDLESKKIAKEKESFLAK